MKQTKLPNGWNEERIKNVISHYENQSEEEAVTEDETAVFMEIPLELVTTVRGLIAKYHPF